VGVRVAERLRESGHRAAVVERDPPCVHIERLRARGCQVIVADASETATLDLAGVDRAAALVALTDSDAANLRIALAGRARHPGVPVVARLTSPDLSAHVSERGDAVALSSVAVASEAFERDRLREHPPMGARGR
jgi:Trk K+ transport system NAD-binding subunit